MRDGAVVVAVEQCLSGRGKIGGAGTGRKYEKCDAAKRENGTAKAGDAGERF